VGTSGIRYKPSGVIRGIYDIAAPGGVRYNVLLEGVDKEENVTATLLHFDPALLRYDRDRIEWLFEDSGLYEAGMWDAHTYVEGPFVDYLNTPVQTFRRENVNAILKTWEATTANKSGQDGLGRGVTSRRHYVTLQWADPNNPGSVGNKFIRVLHFYEGLTGPQYAIPLTNRRNAQTLFFWDDFERGVNLNSGLGISPSGHKAEHWAGVWGTESGKAKLVTAGALPAGQIYTAMWDMGVADGTWEIELPAMQLSGPLVFARAWKTVGGSTNKEGGIVIWPHSSNRYEIWRRWEASSGSLGFISNSVVPTAGDRVRVTCKGSYMLFEIVRAGVVVGSFTPNAADVIANGLTRTYFGIGHAPSIISANVRFDNPSFTSTARKYRGYQRFRDYGLMVNMVPIEGPGSDPAPVQWESTRVKNASTEAGGVTKTDVPQWAASTAVNAGEYRRPKANPNGRHYRAQNSGTTGASEPGTWPTTAGGTVVDNTITWVEETWNAGARSTDLLNRDGGILSFKIEQRRVASDTANRPNGFIPGNAETGQPWRTGAGAWIVASNALKPTAAGSLVLDSGVGSSVIVEAQLPLAVAGARLLVRYIDEANMLYWECLGPASGCRVVKRVAGVETVVKTYSNAVLNASFTNNDYVKIAARDNLITVYRNNVPIQAVDDINESQFIGATSQGIAASAAAVTSGVSFKNFGVYQNYTARIIGFALDNSTTILSDFGYAWNIKTDRTARPVVAGVEVGTALSINVGDELQIEARREVLTAGAAPVLRLHFYHIPALGIQGAQRGNPHHSVTVSQDLDATPMYVDTALYHVGASFNNVTYRRFSYDVFTDPASIDDYGPKWARSVIRKPELDTYAKRKAWADGLLAVFSRPRITTELYNVDASWGYERGHKVPVENTHFGWTPPVLQVIQEVRPGKVEGLRTLIVGESAYEFADTEFGVALKVPDIDEIDPPPAQNFATADSYRDSVDTVAQNFTFTDPGADVKVVWINVLAQFGDRGNVQRAPALPGSGKGTVRGLKPGASYVAWNETEDYNGNTSKPSVAINLTTANIVSILPPSNVVLGGMTWLPDEKAVMVEFVWDEVQGALDYEGTLIVTTLEGITTVETRRTNRTKTFVATVAAFATLLFSVASIDVYGMVGNYSAQVPTTAIGSYPASASPPNGDVERPDPLNVTMPADWTPSATGGGTFAWENGDAASGSRSISASRGTGSGSYAQWLSEIYPIPSGADFYIELSYKMNRTGADAYGTYQFLYYDVNKNYIGSSGSIALNDVTTWTIVRGGGAPLPATHKYVQIKLATNPLGSLSAPLTVYFDKIYAGPKVPKEAIAGVPLAGANATSTEFVIGDDTRLPPTSFNESVDDRVATLLVPGTGMAELYDDAAGSYTYSIAPGGVGPTQLAAHIPGLFYSSNKGRATAQGANFASVSSSWAKVAGTDITITAPASGPIRVVMQYRYSGNVDPSTAGATGIGIVSGTFNSAWGDDNFHEGLGSQVTISGIASIQGTIPAGASATLALYGKRISGAGIFTLYASGVNEKLAQWDWWSYRN
jgi:hypothetical protein